jgi:hypothetical protein
MIGSSFVRKAPKTAAAATIPSTGGVSGNSGSNASVLPSLIAPISGVALPGTRSWLNGLQLTSMGLPMLDGIIGGGVPLGSIVLIKEDEQSSHYDTLLKYFIR